MYSIEPNQSADLTAEERSASKHGWSASGCGCVSVVLFLGLLLVVGVLTDGLEASTQKVIFLPGLIICAVASVALVGGFYVLEYYKSIAATKRAKCEAIKKEADQISLVANSCLKKSTDVLARLPMHLLSAKEHLTQADGEYHSNAYGPFWSEIERAAALMARFQQDVKALSQHAGEYHRILDGQCHNFPVFPARLDMIADPGPVLVELKRLVRLGQTNFQFATIWEQRETREVMLAGFRTLGAAICGMESAVETSIRDLSSSLSAQNASLLGETVEFRKSYEQHAQRHTVILDKIQQQGRRPE